MPAYFKTQTPSANKIHRWTNCLIDSSLGQILLESVRALLFWNGGRVTSKILHKLKALHCIALHCSEVEWSGVEVAFYLPHVPQFGLV